MCAAVTQRWSYHGERHAVDLVFVFGLVLSEGAVPGQDREERPTPRVSGAKRKGGGDTTVQTHSHLSGVLKHGKNSALMNITAPRTQK